MPKVKVESVTSYNPAAYIDRSLLCAFEYLNPREVATLSSVSKAWKQTSEKDELWIKIARENWLIEPASKKKLIPPPGGWKTFTVNALQQRKSHFNFNRIIGPTFEEELKAFLEKEASELEMTPLGVATMHALKTGSISVLKVAEKMGLIKSSHEQLSQKDLIEILKVVCVQRIEEAGAIARNVRERGVVLRKRELKNILPPAYNLKLGILANTPFFLSLLNIKEMKIRPSRTALQAALKLQSRELITIVLKRLRTIPEKIVMDFFKREKFDESIPEFYRLLREHKYRPQLIDLKYIMLNVVKHISESVVNVAEPLPYLTFIEDVGNDIKEMSSDPRISKAGDRYQNLILMLLALQCADYESMGHVEYMKLERQVEKAVIKFFTDTLADTETESDSSDENSDPEIIENGSVRSTSSDHTSEIEAEESVTSDSD